jgi:hypothetical protein
VGRRLAAAATTAAVLAAPALALSACGRDERAAPSAPATTTTAATPPAPAPAPSHRAARPRGRAEGYALAQHRGLVLASRRVHGGRFRLVVRRGSGSPRAVGVPDQDEPFVVAMGADAAGRTVAVYPRADRLVALDLATGIERTVLRTETVARALAIDRGTVIYVLIYGHRSTIRQAPLDGSRPPWTRKRVHGVITSLAASPHGIAYVVFVQTEPSGAHSRNHLIFRDRVIATTGYGEEGGADITSVAFSGPDLMWSMSGSSDGPTYGSVERLNLRTGTRRTLSTPGGGVFAAAPDGGDPTAPTAVAYEPTASQEYEPDPRHQVVRRFPPAAFGPTRRDQNP